MVNQKFKAQSFHGFNSDQPNYQYNQQQQQQQVQQPIYQQPHYQVPSQPQMHYNNTTGDRSQIDSFQRHISLPNYPGVSHPRLVRASSLTNDQLEQNVSGSNIINQSGPGGSNVEQNKFLNVKVTCEFQGDINSMTMNWTSTEIENSRRLVLVTFRQNFNHLTLNFKPIDQNDYIPGTPVISCIYWAEANKFYVTSVDLITLLEYLVNAKFPVEEKNRIRRNLQSLKPLTISKSNPKFYQFFQLIMNFQNPKPRHIEKDVKVLLWSSLKDSLQKVLSKYTIDPTIEHNASSSFTGGTTGTDTSGSTTSTLPTSNSSLSTTTGHQSSSSKDLGQFALPQVQEQSTSQNFMPQYFPYQNLPPPPPPIGSHIAPPPQQQQQQQQHQQQQYQLQPISFPGHPMYQLPNLNYQDHYENLPPVQQQHQQLISPNSQVHQSPMSGSTSGQLQSGGASGSQQQLPTPQNNYNMYYYQ